MEMLSIEDALSSLETAAAFPPSMQAYSCILQKCRYEKKLVHINSLYMHLCNYGLDCHIAFDNQLVPVFVECGSVPDAQRMFNRSVQFNEHNWTSLIQGYVECGKPEDALTLYQKMQQKGVTPNRYTFVALLKACTRLKLQDKAREIRVDLANMGLDKDPFVASILVNMYSKFGLLAEARKLFDNLSMRDVVTWNALMTGFTEHGLGHEALSFMEEMRLDGVSPNDVTCICMLKTCASTGVLERGKEVHMEIVLKGYEGVPLISNIVVDMYAKCGSFAEAQHMFAELPIQDSISWTSLIAGYAEHGFGKEALDCLELMRLEGLSPDCVTFVCSLKACGMLGAIDRGQELHSEITERGYEREIFVGNSLADMYAKSGLVAEAWEIINKLPVRDAVSWNTLITVNVEYGFDKQALVSLEKMHLEGIAPDSVTYICILKACGKLGTLTKGQEIHCEIVKKGYTSNSFIGSSLVDMYGKCGSLEESEEVFEQLVVQDIASWNALVAGYAEEGCWEETLACLEKMRVQGRFPDEITLVYGLRACSSLVAIGKGQDIHSEILKKGFEKETFVGNTLVDMYAKCGSLAEANQVFKDLQEQTVVSWNAIISGFAEGGYDEEVLNCLEQMELQGVSPDVVTFFSCSKACGNLGASEKGLELHTQIATRGFEKDPSVGSSLLCMYAECGLLLELEEVFDNLLVRDVVAWTTLIARYAEHGLFDKVVGSLEQMELEDMSPDVVTLVCVLECCGSVGALDMGRQIYSGIMMKGLEKDPYVGSQLVDMYAKCYCYEEAWHIFNHLTVREAATWAALISLYAELGLEEETANVLEHMLLEGVPLDAFTLHHILQACGNVGIINKGQELHAMIVNKGLDSSSSLGNSLVYLYAKSGRFLEAWAVLDKRPVGDVVSWNALITGYTAHGFGKEALNCFEQMQLEGVPPNEVTYICTLNICSSIGAAATGQDIHSQAVKVGLNEHPVLGSALVDMYAKCGLFEEAIHVFEGLPDQDVVSHTAIIGGLVEHGLSKEALTCLQQMHLDGICVNAITYVCSLKACGVIGAIDKGQELHTEITKKGYDLQSYIGNTLVDMYAKCGSLIEAQKVFNEIHVQDIVSWTALIAGYAECGCGAEVFHYFEKMKENGLSPTDVTFVCCLKVCSIIKATAKGQELHADITSHGFERNYTVGNTLLSMYAKCRLLAEAQDIFDMLEIRDVVSWVALVSGYVASGLSKEGWSCFQQMQLEGAPADVFLWNALIWGFADDLENENPFSVFAQMQEQALSPNSMTFVSLLKACGNKGAIQRGKRFHAQVHGVTSLNAGPIEEAVNTALVDMYGRCGSMVNAQQVFDNMATRELVTWNSLITGYTRQGESSHALILFKKMRDEGVEADDLTFLSILTALNREGLVEEGQMYLKAMNREYGFYPTIKHHSCIVDLLGRAGQLDEVEAVIRNLPVQLDPWVWNSVLGSCQKWGNTEFGRHAFESAVRLEKEHDATFILFSNISADERSDILTLNQSMTYKSLHVCWPRQ